VDAIKIDRSFVSGLAEDSRDQAIVSSLIGLARALGCTVTAEGAETEDQLIALRLLECERVQGSCWLGRCRPRRSRPCWPESRSRLLGRQQPPLTRLTSVG
jgi:EAL domain-containing protein (putative c-di-GMP-specific phosphodiesterase class I)